MVEEKNFSVRIFRVCNYSLLILVTLSCVLPLWYTLCLSLSDKAAANGGMVGLWPVGLNFDAYGAIIKDGSFFRALGISVLRVSLGLMLGLGTTLLMAYPLSKNSREYAPRNVCMWILIICFLFNGGLVPWYITMMSLGMRNTIWALVLSGGVQVFNVILMMNFFRNLPKALEEAAIMDGAGPWRILFSLIIPVSLPVIATVSLFIIVYHWNEFFQGLVLMSSSHNYPLQTYIQQLVVTINMTNMSLEQFEKMSKLSNITLNAAKIFVALIPVLLIYPFLQRYFVTGITLGSVKE
ncbi:MAG: carbohydrate ABC transporter permease [Treponema sp.]|jgi:ABC-type glycerol-3-phosphate transport system permease component|nr:carbohydrate ABC transporter permease [Treponema sp.]